jgi:predicted XRE-type DNA-binding protein
MMKIEHFESVWDAIEATPEEAENMKMRSLLMMSISARLKEWDLSQSAAAKRLGLTQPRLNDLLRGRINKFSLDALTMIASKAGLTVELKIKKAA